MKQLLLLCLCIISFNAFAAPGDTTMPPYKKYPTLPAFEILMLDSATKFNTFNIQEGRFTLLMFFSTDCDHCHMTTDSLLKHMDELKNVQICMAAPQSLHDINAFYTKHNIKNYKNILMGKDNVGFFHKFYQAYYVPVIVLYDKQKNFVKYWEGGARMKDILDAMK